MDASVIASHRFGFGPKPDELNTIAKDPKAWVLRQYRADINIEFKVTEPSSQQVVAKNANFRESTRGLKASDPEKLDQLRDEMTKWMREAYRSYSLDSLQVAIATDNPAKHRLLEFFSNHFSVSANGGAMMRALAPTRA
ncbi:probable signal peptide protein [Vibrio ishigakensis]|uniref:Probable signal peptide protein n=1 Tax=Vibrio ishigakensis TaxID=1481914 RepID=A0A0B8NLZ1_9VIBR|nr:probable signal peptide protein [Vibrio ishigakensis]